MKKEFGGALGRYIDPPRINGQRAEGKSDDEIIRLMNKETNEDNKNLLLLKEHYGIGDSPMWPWLLARALAREYVPAFREKHQGKTGAPKKWWGFSREALVVEIDRKIEEDWQKAKDNGIARSKKSVKWAAGLLIKKDPWKTITRKQLGERSDWTALKKAYDKGKKSKRVADMRLLFERFRDEGKIEKWEEFLRVFKSPPKNYYVK